MKNAFFILMLCGSWCAHAASADFKIQREPLRPESIESARTSIHALAVAALRKEAESLRVNWANADSGPKTIRVWSRPVGLTLADGLAHQFEISPEEAYLGVLYFLSKVDKENALVRRWLTNAVAWLSLATIPKKEHLSDIEQAIAEFSDFLRGYFLSQSPRIVGTVIFLGRIEESDYERMGRLGIGPPNLGRVRNMVTGRPGVPPYYPAYFEKYLALQTLVIPERYRNAWKNRLLLKDENIEEMPGLNEEEAALVTGFIRFLSVNGIQTAFNEFPQLARRSE